jgi:hypothetical protein
MDERLLDCPGSRILAVILEVKRVEIPTADLTVNKRNKTLEASQLGNPA